MHKYLVFVALLGINRLVQSTPPSFSQSFSSSSLTKSSGEAASSSIYTDSQGNRIVNGVNFLAHTASESDPTSSFPALYKFLIPPGDPSGLPYIIETDDQRTPPPVPKPPSYRKPTTVATSTEAPTTRTTRISTSQTTLSQTTRPEISSFIRPSISQPEVSIVKRPSSSHTANNLLSASSTGKRNDGSYHHDYSGYYKPDNRGQYHGN